MSRNGTVACRQNVIESGALHHFWLRLEGRTRDEALDLRPRITPILQIKQGRSPAHAAQKRRLGWNGTAGHRLYKVSTAVDSSAYLPKGPDICMPISRCSGTSIAPARYFAPQSAYSGNSILRTCSATYRQAHCQVHLTHTIQSRPNRQGISPTLAERSSRATHPRQGRPGLHSLQATIRTMLN
ncbi:MAG: hypothetical protein KatS3mg077_3368 [Candidatus Binatia bacterium]|nr:MAG: hypothetical protein KatS3mg077_3368 [Candidatus Binatia bacterium]